MTEKIEKILTIPDAFQGNRLDQTLATLLPEYSRTVLQEWIKNKNIVLNGRPCKRSQTVLGGEEVVISATFKTQPLWEAQSIALTIVYEDDDLLVINKPAGMVVHPAQGNPNNTLLNALLYHSPSLKDLPRAGIIHRLDKDTSGLLIIAKTQKAFRLLTIQMKSRKIKRYYQAIVCGVLISGGTIDVPIGRHPIQRKQMAVIETVKKARTHFRVIEKYRNHTRIRIELETGRTHQIRVHMAHIHYPIVGDQVYGGRLQIPKQASEELIHFLRNFKRQALNAHEIELVHPITKKNMQWQIALPDDMQQLIALLKKDRA